MHVWIIILFGVAVFGPMAFSDELPFDATAGFVGYLMGAGMGWSVRKVAERGARENGRDGN